MKVCRRDDRPSIHFIGYAPARLLTARITETLPIEMLSDVVVREAMDRVRRRERIIDAGMVISSHNARICEVLAPVEALGKLERW